jgi:hypothetical protein
LSFVCRTENFLWGVNSLVYVSCQAKHSDVMDPTTAKLAGEMYSTAYFGRSSLRAV